MDTRELWLPILHRIDPIAGPGGITSALFSRVLHTDAHEMVHVTRFFDVVEVWKRDDDFSVRGYDERMTETTGPFILGMNELDRYEPEAGLLHHAVRREDAALVRVLVEEETSRAIDRVRKTGRIDVIKDLANPVCIRFTQRYYGLPHSDPARLLHLFQVASWYIFSFWKDPVMRAAALPAGEELRGILSGIIAHRRASGDTTDGDVLGRLLKVSTGFSDGDDGIARSIAGLASGTLNAPIGLLANTVNKLLCLDDTERARISALARSARSGPSPDAKQFSDVVHEAERFGVFPSVLYRHAEHDTVLAAGTSREKAIPRGATVVVWPSLSAFDSDVFERPFEFVPGRPGWQYMSFGYGRHRCLGEHIGQVLVHTMTRELLALPRLRRAKGKEGRIRNRGLQEASFPESFVLEFDRAS